MGQRRGEEEPRGARFGDRDRRHHDVRHAVADTCEQILEAGHNHPLGRKPVLLGKLLGDALIVLGPQALTRQGVESRPLLSRQPDASAGLDGLPAELRRLRGRAARDAGKGYRKEG